jgi:hypothetical protein
VALETASATRHPSFAAFRAMGNYWSLSSPQAAPTTFPPAPDAASTAAPPLAPSPPEPSLANTVTALQILADTLVRTASELRGRCDIWCPALCERHEKRHAADSAAVPLSPHVKLLSHAYDEVLCDGRIAGHARALARALADAASAPQPIATDGVIPMPFPPRNITQVEAARQLQTTFFADDALLRQMCELIGGLDAVIQQCEHASPHALVSGDAKSAAAASSSSSPLLMVPMECTHERAMELLRAMRLCVDMHRATLQALSSNTRGVSVYPSNADIVAAAESVARLRGTLPRSIATPAHVAATTSALDAQIQRQQRTAHAATLAAEYDGTSGGSTVAPQFNTLPTVLNAQQQRAATRKQ